MKVKDVMHERAEYINRERTVREAAEMMAKGDYGCLPIEENDRMIGMITDRDITLRVVAKGLDPNVTKVSECMSKGIEYCFEDDNLLEVGEMMASQKIRRMPVINESKRLVGMLSLGDIASKARDQSLSHEILSNVSH
ncbi:CBS domain-containing protein [Bdellovibrio bacteriovorus]|uniref:Putative inosine-5'-monophosphate dehydrogenase protein n=1 Tax=Bdellovibrio bacteriovorus str. Tiberius TaxID=1069642 RepID=K7ZGH9_BDEBC|nr:CBS domain-containing protein [Bdellovibrio bacteriovorus]AFY02502.1 putative inosine-5'-monophosphate dehydrogenase protein [Bdellovibrio bacteriovorus str. Tiberius]